MVTAGYSLDEIYASGAIRVSSYIEDDDGLLLLTFTVEPNSKQIAALQQLARLHGTKAVLIDYKDEEYSETEIPISSPSELSSIIRGKVKSKSLVAQFHERVNQNPYNSLLNEDDLVKKFKHAVDGSLSE